MKTDKLYYKDDYINNFSAVVLSVKREGDYYLTELDKTAFFPEEGGQPADIGTIGEHTVVDVRELDEGIFHYTRTMPEPGREYSCKIDFERRIDRMRCHTAEHILCGIIHRLYGYDNVGFHLGDDTVTFDISEFLDREQLKEIESIANEIVMQCKPIYTSFPSVEELSEIEYRAKLDLSQGVRLVYIGENGEVDICACCAPHVKNTGEIGIIKIIDSMRHRGGVRITMLAGARALSDYSSRLLATRRISELLCVPQVDVSDGVEKLLADHEGLRQRMNEMLLERIKLEADSIDLSKPITVVYYPDYTLKELNELVKLVIPRVEGMLVALSGEGTNIKYIIYSTNTDLRALVKQINNDLCGKGGGKSEQVQGSFARPIDVIISYFEGM